MLERMTGLVTEAVVFYRIKSIRSFFEIVSSSTVHGRLMWMIDDFLLTNNAKQFLLSCVISYGSMFQVCRQKWRFSLVYFMVWIAKRLFWWLNLKMGATLHTKRNIFAPLACPLASKSTRRISGRLRQHMAVSDEEVLFRLYCDRLTKN